MSPAGGGQPPLRVQHGPMRSALVCLLAGVAAAADIPTIEPMVLKAGGGGSISLRPDAPSQLTGGVELQYAGVLVRCQALSATRAPYPGSQQPLPGDIDLSSGPQGPRDAQGAPCVELDTRRSTLPKLAFRGLLTPGQVHASRLAADPRQPGLVRYHLTLIPLGAFIGELRRGGRWEPYHGWAERAEAEVLGDVAPGGLANLRLVRMTMHGAAAAEGQPARPAWLVGPNPHRLPLPGGLAAPAAPVAPVAPVQMMHVEADPFIFVFNAAGDFERLDAEGAQIVELPAPGAATAPAAKP